MLLSQVGNTDGSITVVVREEGGTGLGLAISSSIVADFGGRLTAHNEDEGAVFAVELPLHKAGQAAQPLAAE